VAEAVEAANASGRRLRLHLMLKVMNGAGA
jgi:hypothetical protein